MLQSILNALFRCYHRRTTFPLTIARSGNASAAGGAARTYVVCLDCGRELAYDWAEMRIGETAPVRVPVRQPLPLAR